MKRISIITGLLLAAASFGAGAAEPADKRATGLEHQTLEASHERSDRFNDELKWRDYETSDRGTTFLDFWAARKKVQMPAKAPEQATPNLARAKKNDKSDRDKDASLQSVP